MILKEMILICTTDLSSASSSLKMFTLKQSYTKKNYIYLLSFCNIINVFTVIFFNPFNAFLLSKSIHFFELYQLLVEGQHIYCTR